MQKHLLFPYILTFPNLRFFLRKFLVEIPRNASSLRPNLLGKASSKYTTNVPNFFLKIVFSKPLIFSNLVPFYTKIFGRS
jgi:hypothetical protein